MFLTKGLVLATIAVHMIVSVLQPAIASPYGPYGSSYYAHPRDVRPGTYGKQEVPLPPSVLGVQQNCIGYGAAGMCEPCQISDQCSAGMTCCAVKKLCVRNSCEDCNNEGARCIGGCPDEFVHSSYGQCKCEDSRFPDQWAPQCGHLYDKDTKQYPFEEKKNKAYNNCFPKYETKYKEKCIDYEEEDCTTGHEEKCQDLKFQNCRENPNSKHERKCQMVTEKICQLKRNDKFTDEFEMKKVVKCHKEQVRLCDTTVKLDHSTTDDHLCVDVPRYTCRTEQKTLYEKSCKTSYRFDCRFPTDGSGYGNGMLNHMYAVERYKYQPGIPSNWNMNENPAMGRGLAYGRQLDGNDDWKKNCRKIPKRECQTIPRTRHYQVCEQIKEQKCQKVTNQNPKPVEEQRCKFVEQDKCEVTEQMEPRKINIPWYTPDCKDVQKEICGSVGTTELEVKCSTDVRPVCTFHPTPEKCTKTPRKYCYQAPYQVKTTDCNEKYDINIGRPVPPVIPYA